MAKITNKREYKDSIRGYVDYLNNNEQKTLKGLLFLEMWGTMRNAGNTASIMLHANTNLFYQYM